MADAETPVEVDVNTDNLDDFELLFSGKATQADAPSEEPKADEVDPVDDDTDATEDEPVEDEPSDPEDESGDEEDDSEPEDEDAEDEDEDIFKPKPKAKQTAKERIAELTAARRQAERERDDLERRLRALEESRKEPSEENTNRAPQPVRKVDDQNAPHFDDVYEDGSPVYPLGEFDPNFIADMTDYRFEQRMKQVEAQRAEEEANKARAAEEARLAQAWEGKLSKAEEALPDLRPTIKTLDAEFGSLDPNYGVYLAQTIMSMDAGPEVLYYLANNVNEARDIVASGPQGATLKLGRLEAKVQSALAKKAAKPVRTTKAAKPPVTTRGTGSRGSVRGDTDNLDAFEKEFFKR